MTRDKQLALIRQKCIEVNPEIVDYDKGFAFSGNGLWAYAYTDAEGINRHSQTFKTREEANQHALYSSLFPERPIRLSDVLLAIQHQRGIENGGKVPTSAKQIFETTGKVTELIWLRWNLRKDDLTEQSDECIAFLADLLKA